MISTNKVHQWGGAALMLGSLLFFINKLNEMSLLFLSRPMADLISGENIRLIFIGQVAFIMGYVGFWRLYAEQAGRWGKHALRLFCVGGILMAIGHVTFISNLPSYTENLFLLVLLGMLLIMSGLIWFGIRNLRQPVLARWRWLPLATGVMGFIGFFLFSGDEITAVFLLFRTLFALGLFGLGLTMWLEKPLEVGADIVTNV